MAPMPLNDQHVANLVAALLTVNLYPVDKAVGLMPAFRARGLLDPTRVAGMSHPELAEAMRAAGYDRGGFVPIVSFRLYPLMEAIAAGELDGLPTAAAQSDFDSFCTALSAIHGFGPSTSGVAWDLWT